MRKIYIFNGRKIWADEKTAPEGAVLYSKQKAVPVKEVSAEDKSVKKTANKSKKAEGTK